MFKCVTDIREWLDLPSSNKHPNFMQIIQAWAVAEAMERQIHNHPLKDQVLEWFSLDQGNAIAKMAELLGQKDELRTIMRETVEANFPMFMEKLRERYPLMPPAWQAMFDLEKETYLCPVDQENKKKIIEYLNQANKLYELED